MRILFLGDIVGKPARDALTSQLPDIRKNLNLDCVIVNGENAAHGFGITPQICDDFYKAGVDCITTGNHIWDQREIITYIEKDPKLLRPLNLPKAAPGRGFYEFTTAAGEKILVVNAMARLFMDAIDDPFAAMNELLKSYTLGANVNSIFVDFHGEATSEKTVMGYFCDGRVSMVVGTHSHVPTADLRLLPKGTAYQTDAGMCGCYDSVIGMEVSIAMNNFTRKVPGERLRPVEGPVTLCGVYLETDSKTGLPKHVEPFRMGGVLIQAAPKAA